MNPEFQISIQNFCKLNNNNNNRSLQPLNRHTELCALQETQTELDLHLLRLKTIWENYRMFQRTYFLFSSSAVRFVKGLRRKFRVYTVGYK